MHTTFESNFLKHAGMSAYAPAIGGVVGGSIGALATRGTPEHPATAGQRIRGAAVGAGIGTAAGLGTSIDLTYPKLFDLLHRAKHMRTSARTFRNDAYATAASNLRQESLLKDDLIRHKARLTELRTRSAKERLPGFEEHYAKNSRYQSKTAGVSLGTGVGAALGAGTGAFLGAGIAPTGSNGEMSTGTRVRRGIVGGVLGGALGSVVGKAYGVNRNLQRKVRLHENAAKRMKTIFNNADGARDLQHMTKKRGSRDRDEVARASGEIQDEYARMRGAYIPPGSIAGRGYRPRPQHRDFEGT